MSDPRRECFACVVENVKFSPFVPVYTDKHPEDLPDGGLKATCDYVRWEPWQSIYPDDEYIIYPSGSDFEDSDLEGLDTEEVRHYGIPYSTIVARRDAKAAIRKQRRGERDSSESDEDEYKPEMVLPEGHLEKTLKTLQDNKDPKQPPPECDEVREARENPKFRPTYLGESDECISEFSDEDPDEPGKRIKRIHRYKKVKFTTSTVSFDEKEIPYPKLSTRTFQL